MPDENTPLGRSDRPHQRRAERAEAEVERLRDRVNDEFDRAERLRELLHEVEADPHANITVSLNERIRAALGMDEVAAADMIEREVRRAG